MEVKPHCVHPNPMLDIGRAILYVREHAQEWGVDDNRIAICGFSAGAHNCAMYATMWTSPVVQDYFQVEKQKLRPDICILGYTLSDYTYAKEQNGDDQSLDSMLFEASCKAFLGNDYKKDEKLAEVSPALQVSAETPPVFLWATAEDTLVPVQHSLRMAHALADQKIPFEIHIFENGPHGLSMANQSSSATKSFCFPDAAKWVGLCEAWMMKRFSLQLPQAAPWESAHFQL